VLDRVSGVVDRRPDDMAACLLRFGGEPAAPAVLIEEIELDGETASRERVERFLLAAGMHPGDVEGAAASVRRAVSDSGRVVVELHYADGAPEMVVRPLNVAMLKAWRPTATSAEPTSPQSARELTG
jgi:hypothetical protein